MKTFGEILAENYPSVCTPISGFDKSFIFQAMKVAHDQACDKELELANRIVKVLKKKALYGNTDKFWAGYENGNGQQVGTDIDCLILFAEKIIKSNKNKKV